MAIFTVQVTTDSPPDLTKQTLPAQVRELEKFFNGAQGRVFPTTTLSSFATGVKATGTITLASATAGMTVEINGVPFTGKASTAVAADNLFSIDTGDTEAAASLASVINSCTDARISGVVTATSALGVVTLTSFRSGYGGNAITLKTLGIVATDAVTISGADVADTLSINGAALTAIKQRATGTLTASTAIAGNTCSVNGVTFTGVAGAVVAGTRNFSIDTGNTETATSLAAQINACTDPLISGIVTATSASAVVTVRAVTAGTGGNSIALTGTAVTLAASGAALAGGIAVANDQFDVSPGATDTQVAADIARCINASTTSLITNHVRATSAAAVVTVYSKYGGLIANQITCAGSDGDISAATARLAGATVASTEGAQATQTTVVSGADGGTYATVINGVTINATGTNGNDTTTAASIVTAINASTNAAVRGVVYASSSSGTVTLTAVKGGLSGNQITVSVTGTGYTATGARLASGALPTTVVLSAERLTGGSNVAANTLSY